jgi:diguanylate cyclase
MALSGTIFRDWKDVVFVDALQRDHIDADGNACILGGVDPREHSIELSATGNLVKTPRIQAVEADIDPADMCGGQGTCMLRKQASVGRQSQFVKPPCGHMRAQMLHQNVDIAARQRLSACQAYAPNTMIDKPVRDERYFGVIEQFVARQEFLILWHAIMATEIAPVRHRNAQIINLSSETVEHLAFLSVLPDAGNGCETLCGYYNTVMTVSASQKRSKLLRMSRAREAREWLSAYNQKMHGSASLFLIGIRDLKQINERHGRGAGDAAIRQVGHRITQFAAMQLPKALIVARLPGREFLMVLDGPRSDKQSETVADALLDALSGNLGDATDLIHINARVGFAQAEENESGAELHFRASDALAKAYARKGKRHSGARSNLEIGFKLQAELDAGLRIAIESDQIAIMLQPQFDVANGHLVGAEALARWHHPDLGEIGAAKLFATADRCDMRDELSQLIQRKAITIAAHWTGALGDLRLAVNLGAEELSDGYSDRMIALLQATGFDAGRLTLELTEESLIRDIDQAAAQLEKLRAFGIRIAVDDFGTGYSSLSYLKDLPLDYLKIDKGMTPDIVGTGKDRIVLRAIIAMSKALELKIIAEGVESENELELLQAEGCDYFQGFLRSPPLSAEAFEKFALLAN